MSTTGRIDVFKSVHKGLRRALFDLSLRAGIAEADRPEDLRALAAKAREVFHFLEHHARNEERFLIPIMAAKSLAPASRLRSDHAALDAEVDSLRAGLDRLEGAPSQVHGFYLALNRFLARYLAHLDEEEAVVLPLLHAAFTDAELASFPQQSVAATAPADQAMMLGHMFPAMQACEVRAFFGKIRVAAPRETVQHLEGIARQALGPKADAVLADEVAPNT